MNIVIKDFTETLTDFEVVPDSHVFLNGQYHEWKDLPKALQAQYSRTVTDLHKTILDALLPLSKTVLSTS